MRIQARKSAFRLTFVLASLLVLTACAAPSHLYAANKKSGTYFTLPYSWKRISQSTLTKQESLSKATGAAERLAAVQWQEAYSPSKEVSAAEIFSLKSPPAPTVYVRVRALTSEEMNSVSYNSLRDIFVPLTSWLNSTSDFATTPVPMTKFQLLGDEERVEKGARGVRSIFSFTGADGIDQTFNQTALISPDHSIMYILLVRARSVDYAKSQKILTDISNSFTVLGAA